MYTDDNLSLITEMKRKIETEIPQRDVSIYNGTLGEHMAIDYFAGIRINCYYPSDSQQRSNCNDEISDCPECNSANLVADEERGKTVCGDCGLVVETEKVEDGLVDDQHQIGTIQNGTPEIADEWRMWYPCPECKSTTLEQITEQHLSVSATEDGSYGGDAGSVEEYYYVECGDCGEVPLDEIS